MSDTYISTPNADEFREATATVGGTVDYHIEDRLVWVVPADEVPKTTTLNVTVDGNGLTFNPPEGASVAPASIIDIFTPQESGTTGDGLIFSASTVSWEARPEEQRGPTEAELENITLRHDVAFQKRALHRVEKDRDAALAKLAERDKDYVAAEIDARDARFTLGALRHTLTPKEAEQFEEGLRHLLVVEASERDIEDAERENAHLQGEMAKQRAEYTARYTAANRQIDALLTTIANAGVSTPTLVADVHTQIGIMLEAGKVESDYHRNRNELERNKQTIVRAKQIAAEHALSGRALICAAFARSPELPTKPKLTVDEKLNLANLASMED